MFLFRLVKEQRLFDFREELLKAETLGTVPFKIYENTYYSFDAAKKDFNLEAFYLKSVLDQENYLKDGLKKDGLSDEQIKEVIEDGKYVKFSKGKKQ